MIVLSQNLHESCGLKRKLQYDGVQVWIYETLSSHTHTVFMDTAIETKGTLSEICISHVAEMFAWPPKQCFIFDHTAFILPRIGLTCSVAT